jgi:hypothetical protein
MVKNDGRAHLADAVTQQLVYTNSAINFFLYCLSGSKFRKELIAIFRKTNRVGTGMEISVTEGNLRF